MTTHIVIFADALAMLRRSPSVYVAASVYVPVNICSVSICISFNSITISVYVILNICICFYIDFYLRICDTEFRNFVVARRILTRKTKQPSPREVITMKLISRRCRICLEWYSGKRTNCPYCGAARVGKYMIDRANSREIARSQPIPFDKLIAPRYVS